MRSQHLQLLILAHYFTLALLQFSQSSPQFVVFTFDFGDIIENDEHTTDLTGRSGDRRYVYAEFILFNQAGFQNDGDTARYLLAFKSTVPGQLCSSGVSPSNLSANRNWQ